MLLSLLVEVTVFASFAMDEMIPATVTCSLFVQLDLDSIPVDVPVALTALGTLRLPHILRRLHPQRLPGTTLDTFNSRETPARVSHGLLFRAAVHAPFGDHHMPDNGTLRLLGFDPIDPALFLALQPASGILAQDGADFHLLFSQEWVGCLGHNTFQLRLKTGMYVGNKSTFYFL
jgi:hypothetical protein